MMIMMMIMSILMLAKGNNQFTLPFKVMEGVETIQVPSNRIIPWTCKDCRWEKEVVHIPISSFNKCWILKPLPQLGRVVGDDIVLDKEDLPLIRLPTFLPDETQFKSWVLTLSIYLITIFVFLMKWNVFKRSMKHLANVIKVDD